MLNFRLPTCLDPNCHLPRCRLFNCPLSKCRKAVLQNKQHEIVKVELTLSFTYLTICVSSYLHICLIIFSFAPRMPYFNLCMTICRLVVVFICCASCLTSVSSSNQFWSDSFISFHKCIKLSSSLSQPVHFNSHLSQVVSLFIYFSTCFCIFYLLIFSGSLIFQTGVICIDLTLTVFSIKMGLSQPLFLFIFDLSTQSTGFELRTSVIRSDRSTNWATTTDPKLPVFEDAFKILDSI